MRVNLGSGHVPIKGWVNVDANPEVHPDVCMDSFDFVRDHGREVTELYMGHFLEHLMPSSAEALLVLIAERLPEGAQVSAVVPDMRAIFRAYDRGEITNEELNERFVYSYEQASHHVWCYDATSLRRVFEDAGYCDVEEIDPLTWDPVFWKEGPESRWQCGVRATVPVTGRVRDRSTNPPEMEAGDRGADAVVTADDEATADELLLRRIQQLRERVDQLEASSPDEGGAAPAPSPLFDRLPTALAPAARRTFPEGSRQRRAARLSIDAARATREHLRLLRDEVARSGVVPPRPVNYRSWQRAHALEPVTRRQQRLLAAAALDPVAVECVVLLRDRSSTSARRTLESLRAQTWVHWEALVVGDAAQSVVDGLDDERVRARVASADRLEEINGAIDHEARPSFVVVLEAGDALAPECFFEIARVAREDPLVDLVYWDDDVIDRHGRRHDPRFRPVWSPEVLLNGNYVGRSFAIRHRRLLLLAGLRCELGAAAWWDLLLRAELDARRVRRIPRVLAHLTQRPEVPTTTGTRVVEEHLQRTGQSAVVRVDRGAIRLTWAMDSPPAVTVVVPTRHNRTLVGKLLRDLAATDYPAFDVVVVDNGEQTDDNERWYEQVSGDLRLRVEWWVAPFNYSAVNNAGSKIATGDVLVFLNDDTELPDPTWLREMVSWAVRPEVGVVGAQLVDGDGRIQHGGVILGMSGFADHLFQGMRPGAESLLGPTSWYRNVLAVTGACCAIRRALFEELGGFDERFELLGSDVALGLDAVGAGYRNVCTPFTGVRHLESATRGAAIPADDFFTSWWRYQRWIMAGDPYFSPSLSLASRVPSLRSRYEPSPMEKVSEVLGREFRVFRQASDAEESFTLADLFRVTVADARAVQGVHHANRARFAVRTVNWFLPDIDSPFYGGINTALRLADHLAREHGVENRFVFWAEKNEPFFRSAIAAAFPALAGSPLSFHDSTRAAVNRTPDADVAIATLWATAYSVAQFDGARRKFYMIQDFEPMFYPAGTLYALAEESYRLGLYGLCNTEHMLALYRSRYHGRGTSFQPAVDPSVFHARGRVDERRPDDVATVFVYARPGHWRNCWELASLALEQLKDRLGDRVRIVTAGSWARPDDLGSSIQHLGLLDYRHTGALYRSVDVGVALTVSEHPSYLPLELMACGVPVVAFDNPAGHWLLRDGENSILARQTVDGLCDAIERLVRDPELCRELSRAGIAEIAAQASSWPDAFRDVYSFLCDPEGARS
jgi:GT2 family glycosyltransferase/glycosyltransferase involved in cell wall biosynthesis/predicted SAM-dependent methyltransferase